jgi:hypothetical protein
MNFMAVKLICYVLWHKLHEIHAELRSHVYPSACVQVPSPKLGTCECIYRTY